MKEINTLKDLRLDGKNPNLHTKRGMLALRRSMERLGMGRPVLVSADGVVLSGNATVKEALKKGVPVVVLRTDGRRLIVVKRRDMKSTDAKAVEMKIADNRVSELNLDWDMDVIAEAKAAGVAQEWFDQFDLDLMLGDGAWDHPTEEAKAVAGQVVAEVKSAQASPEEIAVLKAERRKSMAELQAKSDPNFSVEIVFPSWTSLRQFQARWGLPSDLFLPGAVFRAALEERLA